MILDGILVKLLTWRLKSIKMKMAMKAVLSENHQTKFNKNMLTNVKLRFVDSVRLLNSSLDELISYSPPHYVINLLNEFSSCKIFLNKLMDKHVTPEQYVHA